MISFTVRMTVDSKDLEEVSAILRELTAASRHEPGCVSYIPHFVEDESCVVLIYEQYANEAALEHHRQSAHFRRFAVEGLYPKVLKREMEMLVALC